MDILNLYCLGTDIKVNKQNSISYANTDLEDQLLAHMDDLILDVRGNLEDGIKYLGFFIQLKTYKILEWQ